MRLSSRFTALTRGATLPGAATDDVGERRAHAEVSGGSEDDAVERPVSSS